MDPFGEPPEPQMPLDGTPEEQLEHLRTVLKQKTETLARARTLYAERESALHALRASEATWRGQVTEARDQLGALKELPSKMEQASEALSREAARTAVAESRVAELEGELRLLEEDRKDLSRSLAEVEAELSRFIGELENERNSRGTIAEELIGAKEALSQAQDRVAELVAERSEMEGALEAVREQYQANLAELEQAGEELRAAQRERELVAAERAGLAARVGQLEALLVESQESSGSVAELTARLEEAEAELASLRESLAVSESEVVGLRDRMETDAVALGEAAEKAEARVAELEAELKTMEADRQDLSRALADVEAELGRVRDQTQQESGRAAVAEARVAELEAELKTMEADRQDLSRALADVEAELGRARSQEEASRDKEQVPEENSPASGDLIAERDQLREDVAAMKRKLMVAETALEAAASYKMKVARLEAQLAQLRGEK